MNASVQYITSPWSGHIWTPGASATGIQGGGAATPVLGGTGFSWATIVGSKVGGPVSTYLPNVRGVPMTASFVRRYPGRLRGLGQSDITDVMSTDIGTMQGTDIAAQAAGSLALPPAAISDAGITNVQSATSQLPWYAVAATAAAKSAGTIAQQYVSFQNPLLQKQTFAFTPQGGVFATNQPTTTAAGAVASGLSSMLPILLIGGLFLMMMSRRT